MISTDRMSADAIRAGLKTATIGRQLHLLGEVDSTNARMRALARDGAPDGTVVFAEGQTDGRGRRGQRWFSPSGTNVYASVLLRPALGLVEAGAFTFIASLAVSDAIRGLGVEAAIKWPNDVLVRGRKVAGALAECALRGPDVDHVIIGVGINVNVDLAALRSALGAAGAHATSLSAVMGHDVDRNALAAGFLNALEPWYDAWRRAGSAPIIRAWSDRDILTGRRVEVRGPTALAGRVLGVDGGGRLLVQDGLGRTHAVTGDDVRPGE